MAVAAGLVSGATLAIPSLGAHVLFGAYGWFSRYEIYAMVILAASVLRLIPKTACRRASVCLAAALVLVLVGRPYLETTWISPAAARNIYEQQYQMHRLAVDCWDGPVAVNDLGWVSYQNPNYVLDLWGLGSEEVRLLKRMDRFEAGPIQELVASKDVRLVMIYEFWFAEKIPRSWEKIAVLETRCVSTASGKVSLFATRAEDAEEIRAMVARFARGLPEGVGVRFWDPPAS